MFSTNQPYTHSVMIGEMRQKFSIVGRPRLEGSFRKSRQRAPSSLCGDQRAPRSAASTRSLHQGRPTSETARAPAEARPSTARRPETAARRALAADPRESHQNCSARAELDRAREGGACRVVNKLGGLTDGTCRPSRNVLAFPVGRLGQNPARSRDRRHGGTSGAPPPDLSGD